MSGQQWKKIPDRETGRHQRMHLIQSGIEREEITHMVEEQLGYPYGRKFCEEAMGG